MRVTHRSMRSTVVLLWIFTATTGCSALVTRPIPPPPPGGPAEPRAALQSLEDVVNTDPVFNSVKNEPTKGISSKSIAVMDFQETAAVGMPGGGTLVADMLAISFGRANREARGPRVVERQHIQKIIAEQALMKESRALTDIEKAQQIGRIAQANYIIFGALTEFSTQTRDVNLRYFISQPERDRYVREYEIYERNRAEYVMRYGGYREEYNAYLRNLALLGGRPGAAAGPAAIVTAQPLSIEQIEDRVAGRPSRTALANIANIGLTVRVINVTTGSIVWIGQASKRHLQLQEGLQILTRALVEDFLKEPQ